MLLKNTWINCQWTDGRTDDGRLSSARETYFNHLKPFWDTHSVKAINQIFRIYSASGHRGISFPSNYWNNSTSFSWNRVEKSAQRHPSLNDSWLCNLHQTQLNEYLALMDFAKCFIFTLFINFIKLFWKSVRVVYCDVSGRSKCHRQKCILLYRWQF